MASSNTFKLYLPPHPPSTENAHYHSIDDYRKTRKLGEGGCAMVFGAKHKYTGIEVAIKKIARTDDDTSIAAELGVLQGTRHENIIQLHDFLWTSTNFYFVLELANQGSLMERGPLAEWSARIFFGQIICGLSYLHKHNIAHLDIKPENILINIKDGREIAKLTDFGISQMPGDLVVRHEGTPEYMPPEVHLEKRFNGYQADLWSMGVTLYVMLTGSLPFYGKHAEDSRGLEESILKAEYSLPGYLTSFAQSLIGKLLQYEPMDRHCLEKLNEDKWLDTDCSATFA